ncbi:MAG: methyltransferase domain-containing protein [Proteobacteria bacterium]|nr:MAG: methyltransferase domain-containing protein [Pseudomonadota bacterium]
MIGQSFSEPFESICGSRGLQCGCSVCHWRAHGVALSCYGVNVYACADHPGVPMDATRSMDSSRKESTTKQTTLILMSSRNPTPNLSHPHWVNVARQPLDDIREALVTGYKTGKAFESNSYDLFRPGRKARKLLDFGCAIGRNFPALRRHARQIVAYDLPEMIDACARYAECDDVQLVSDWEFVRAQEFDVCVATLVFQHIEDPDVLNFFLEDLSHSVDYLYVNSRCWIDGDEKRNLVSAIVDPGNFTYAIGNVSEAEARGLRYPSDAHIDVLFRSTHRLSSACQTGKLFGLYDLSCAKLRDSKGVTIAQEVQDIEWRQAKRVLMLRKEYADIYGYQIVYFQGRHPLSSDRDESWRKILFILELFESPETDWVFWSDINLGPLNVESALCKTLEAYGESDLIVRRTSSSADGRSDASCDLDLGAFYIRKTDWSREFLDLLWRLPLAARLDSGPSRNITLDRVVGDVFDRGLLNVGKHAAILEPEGYGMLLDSVTVRD